MLWSSFSLSQGEPANPPPAEPKEPTAGAASPSATMTVRGRRRAGYSVHEASTATKTSTSLLEIPQSIQVIPRQLLEDQQATDIADVLDNVSGVQRTGFDDTGVIPQFTVRGFELSAETNFFRDGKPMNLSVPPPTSMMEKVEFVKGPASALYGQSQPGGMVNMILKRPGRHYAAQSSTRLGSYHHLTQNLDVGGPITKTLGLRAMGEYRVADSFRDFGRNRGLLAGAIGGWQPNKQWLVKVAGNRQRHRQAADSMLISGPPLRPEQSFGDRAVDVPISRSLNEPWTHVHVDADWATYDVNFKPWREVEFSHSVGYQYQTNDELRADPDAVQSAVPTLGLVVGNTQKTLRSRRTESRTLSADLRAMWGFETGPLTHRVLAGADIRESADGYREFAPVTTPVEDFNVYEPVYRPPPPGLGYRLTLLSRSELNQWGVYVQDQIGLWEDVHVLLSLRYDGYHQDSERSRFDSAGYTLEDQTGRQFTQRLGASWEMLEDLSVFYSFSGGFKPNRVPFGGALVAPETSGQWEGGVKTFLLDGFLHLTLSGYTLTKRNVRVENPVTGFTTSDGEHKSRGLELDVIGDLMPGLNLLANYSLLDAKVTKGLPPSQLTSTGTTVFDATGTVRVASPKHSGRLWLTYRLQSPRFQGLSLGGGATARSEVQGDRENTLQHPGYINWDAMAAYRKTLGSLRLGAQINVKNLTNSVYYYGKVRQRITPATPRSVFATLSVQFDAGGRR